MPFSREQFEAAGGDWATGYYCNRILEEVATTRSEAVDHADYKSAIACKYAVLRQSLTYRIVDLVQATMSAWGNGKYLGSLIIGRSVLETVALIHSIEHRARQHLSAKDFQKLDELATKELYSAKAKDYLLDPKFVATNILAALDRLDKAVPALKKYHATLSEYAHPNAKGHHLFFGKYDKDKQKTYFAPDMTRGPGTVRHVMSACLGIIVAQLDLLNIDKLITEIAAAHEAHLAASKKE
jgi:hypothetical protein